MIDFARIRRAASHSLCALPLLFGLPAPGIAAEIAQPVASEDVAPAISTADLLKALAATRPKSRPESVIVLKAKTEAMVRLATDKADDTDPQVALAFCTSAVAQAETLYDSDPSELLPVLRAAAQVELRFGNAARAVQHLTKADAISQKALGSDDPARRFLLAELAGAYAKADAPAKAKEVAEKSAYLDRIALASIQTAYTLGNGSDVADNGALYQIVPVFFETTRVRTGKLDPLAFYGATRDVRSHYGVSYVSVPRDRQIGTIPHASIYRFDLSPDPGRHVILKEVVQVDDQADFWKKLQGRMASSVRKEALVYIHGFNQSFQDGVETAATLAADLEIDGEVVTFSWPSRNNIFLYAADLDEAAASLNRQALRDLLSRVATQTGAQHVYVVAHSMGNRLLLESMRQMLPATGAQPIEKLVFASPDMESADFVQSVDEIGSLSKQMTLYTAAGDLALDLSDVVHGVFSHPARAGNRDGGVRPTPLLDVVDTSKAKADLLGHDNFVYLAKDDLRALVWFGLPAAARCVLVGKRSDGWRYDPASPCTSEAFSLASLYFRRYADGDVALSKLGAQGDPTSRSAGPILRAMLALKQ